MVNAICWTLIHSLWQGLIAALLAGIMLLSTRRSSPQLRYNLLAMVFFGLFLAVVGTFAWECPSITKPEVGLHATEIPTGQTSAQPLSASTTSVVIERKRAVIESSKKTPGIHRNNPIAGAVAYLDAHALLIVSAWLLIMMIRLVRNGLSLGYMRRVRRRQAFPAPEEWQSRVSSLARSLGLSRPAQLLESTLIRVPIVIGYLKPVILFPAGVLALMPPDQLEAVLLHELAHIRRGDFLVNILQGLVEAMLFFNPAVWWISSLIRSERENCCDDIAIASTNNKSHLIRAMIAFQEYSMATSLPVVAFPGSGNNHLLDRVKRIVYNQNKTLNAAEKVFLGASLFVAVSFALAFTPVRDPHHPDVAPTALYRTLFNGRDTVPLPVSIASAQARKVISGYSTPPAPPEIDELERQLEDGGYFYGIMKDASYFNGGTNITRSVYDKGIWVKHKIRQYYDQGKVILATNGQIKEIWVDGERIPTDQLDKYKQEANQIIAYLEHERQVNPTSYEENEWLQSNKLSLKAIDIFNDGVTVNGPLEILTTVDTPRTFTHQIGYPNQTFTITKEMLEVTKMAIGDTAVRDQLMDDLINEILNRHLANDPKHLSFKLDRDSLIVNKVPQPSEVLKSIVAKYSQLESYHFIYSRNGAHINSASQLNFPPRP